MRRRRHGRRQQDVAELNVTAFMNLMVVLVPFLLIMAVFSRIAIHELNLPGEAAEQNEEPKLQLEVIVRDESLIVADRAGGALSSIPNTEEGYDLVALSDKLKAIKAEFPDVVSVTVLLEPDIAYDHVIQVMDTVRMYPAEQDGEPVNAELFPEISLGDAPIKAKGSG